MSGLPDALAVVVVRDGLLPAGADEATAETGGYALLVGPGLRGPAVTDAVRALTSARRVWVAETGTEPGTLAAALAPLLEQVRTLVLPGSPDGRDLAPRLAAALGRPLLAGAVEVLPHGADVLRWGGTALVELTADGPFLATLEPGLRGVEPVPGPAVVTEIEPAAVSEVHGARTLAVHDVSEEGGGLDGARRVLCAGGGVGSPQAVALLGRVATALGAALGGTRVVTDAGWLGYDRQIGTTGVGVDPGLYVAFGVSGAPHHMGGLGRPRHVVSVNTDPYCAMTAMADLGIVADAAAVLEELARKLEAEDD
ncbi:mycofactocin-associated electron transfer flavoprotein alpha subunit [Streptomyces sp. NPDC047065]|uniref:mycofactocin-associated electron transfer flavoprotein alpha subunit n=1 Tax=Streptomyces sp. NPDC047065 TaxID=3154606 RepID=UPI0033F1C041